MEFNIASIEAESNAIYHGNQEEQKNANSFLIAWQNSPNAEMLAFQLIQSAEATLYTKNICCAIIKNFILRRFYSNLDPNARLQFRQNVLVSLSKNFQNNFIIQQTIPTIVLIALYEWPDNWPEFPFEIYPQQEDQGIRTIFFTELFNELIIQVLNSKLIDPDRRVALISNLSANVSSIFSFVVPEIGIENCNNAIFDKAMELLINLLKIAPIENFQNENVLNLILSSFPFNEPNEKYHIQWLKFADKLLLKHPGRESLIPTFSKPILSVACQIESHSTYLSHFIIRFLTKYSDNLILLGIKETNETNSNEMLQFITKQYLMTLKSPLLDSVEIFDIWYLWLDLFRSDTINIPTEGTKPEQVPSPLHKLITFDEIIGPIFEMLLRSSKEYKAQKVVFKTMAALYDLYPDKINDILINSPLVPQVCLTMELLWNAIEEAKMVEIATSLYSKVLANKNELLNPTSLLAMSFCHKFLEKNIDAQNSLIEILCEIIKALDPNYLEPLSQVLDHLSEYLSSIYINNNEMLLNTLLENINPILLNSMQINDGEIGTCIFKAVCTVSMQFPNEEKRNHIFMGLSSPILEFLNNKPALLFGLRCLSIQPDKSSIFQFVIEKLVSLYQVVFNEQDDFPDVNCYLTALSKGLAALPFQSINTVFIEILKNLFQKPKLAPQTFSMIEIMRKNYNEVEQILPDLLLNNLIVPYLENRIQNASEIKSVTDSESQASNENYVQIDSEFFSMISQFSPNVFTIPQIMQAFVFGIRDMRLDVVKSSANSLKDLIDKITTLNELMSFMQTFRRGLLNSLFIAIFDMLHSSSFSAHCKLLQFFFTKSMNISFELAKEHQDDSVDLSLFEQEFCEEICHVLNLNLAEPTILQMLRNLFYQLKLHYLTSFKEILTQFLISSNRTTNDGIMNIEEQSELNRSSNFDENEQQPTNE
ncbi:Karyopherin transporter [Tritrichomonas musculus]|uniref:Karyopherin transporter n=1 Tax=Tritrichomonas musculus TaxID=1915356 RepID=A0ABR2H8Q9_9EUKA